MAAGLLIFGFLSAFAGVIGMAVIGAPLWLTLLAYPIFGALGLLIPAIFLALGDRSGDDAPDALSLEGTATAR